jgi:uncharacterized coiled-coil DUF342 family protein
MSDEINKEIDLLHERTQETKSSLSTHEAVCQERYNRIMENLQALHSDVAALKKLATEGRTSLRTLFFVGAVIGGLIAALSAFSNIKW